MHSSLADLIHDWHDFYLLVGTASATLVGLMFVTGSIGAQLFTEKNREALRAFVSPTVVHFTAVLLICIAAMIPMHTRLPLAFLLLFGGAAGAVYSARVGVQLFIRRRFEIDLIDRLFYALVPVLGYAFVLAASILLLLEAPQWSLEALAAAVITLLLAGIRNAWDMTLWIVIRVPTSETTTDGGT